MILFGVRIVVWVDVFFLLYLFWCLMMLIFIGSCNELLLVIVLLKEYKIFGYLLNNVLDICSLLIIIIIKDIYYNLCFY